MLENKVNNTHLSGQQRMTYDEDVLAVLVLKQFALLQLLWARGLWEESSGFSLLFHQLRAVWLHGTHNGSVSCTVVV